MNAKKLLALFLVLVMVPGCLGLTAFAETAYSKDITISMPEITIGTTVASVKSGASINDSNLEIINVSLADPSNENLSSVENKGLLLFRITVKLKDLGSVFAGENGLYTGNIALQGTNEYTIGAVEIGNLDSNLKFTTSDSGSSLMVTGYVNVGNCYCKYINVTYPSITVGDKKNAIFAGSAVSDSDNLEIVGMNLFDADKKSVESITVAGTYYIQTFIKLKNNTDFYATYYDQYQQFCYTGHVYANGKAVDPACEVCGYNLTDTNGIRELVVQRGDSDPETLSYLSVLAPVYAYDAALDLDTTSPNKDRYSDTAAVDQLYDATVTGGKTDVTKVQVSWTLPQIAVTVTKTKAWDTEKLVWVDDKNNASTATASSFTAEFDFVNLSSKKVDATVTFAVNSADNFTAVTPTFTDDGVTGGDGVITLGTKANGASADNDGNIKVSVSPNADDFKDKSDTGIYGTYTVTIARVSYAVSATMTNATAAENNPIKIKENGTATLVFTATDGNLLPTDTKYTDVISVTGATVDSWTLSNEGTTGTLVISNPTSAVSVTLTGGTKPVIETEPQDKTQRDDTNFTFSVSATGNDLSYQWMVDDDLSYLTGEVAPQKATPQWKVMENGKSSQLTTTVSIVRTKYFKCVVSNPYGSVESKAVYGFCKD